MIYVSVEKYGNKIVHIYLDEFYKRIKKVIPFEPTVYECVKEKTNFRDIQGHYFNPVKTESIKKYEETWKDTANHYYLTTLSEKYQFISEMYPNDITFDGNKIPKMFFDIEVASINGFPDPNLAQEEILSIAMYMPHINKTVVLGNKDGYIPTDKNIEYFYVDDEKDIIRRFFDIIHQYDICFILGWNSSGFDIPYIIKRGGVLGMDFNKILPLGYFRETFDNVTKTKTIEIPGLIHYDYMLLIKKFWDEKFESYSLDFIANHFLGEGKVDYADHATLQNLYENDYQKFIDYNIKDAILISNIDKLKQLFNLVVEISYLSKINPSDVYGSMKIWDGLIYNTLIKQGILIPNAPTEEQLEESKDKDDEQFVGAWVKDPERGMHEWVTSFDVSSMYPNNMISYNMSCLTIVPKDKLPEEIVQIQKDISVENLMNKKYDMSVLKKYNLSMAANGAVFDISKQDLLTQILEKIYFERKKIQKQAEEVRKKCGECDEYYTLKNKAWALKIIINSYYGITGNKYYRFSNVNVAEAVTLTGQYLLKSVGDVINKKLNNMFGEKNRFIYGDTDSVYICLDDFIKDYESKKKKFDDSKQKAQFILDVSNKIIGPLIEKTIADMADYTNCFKNSLVMKREKICEKALFIQKKKYLLYIKNDDNFLLDTPKLTVKGVEIVRTSTPQIIRTTLKEFVKFIFETNDKNKLMEKLAEFRNQYNNYSIEQISFPRGISDIAKHDNINYNVTDDEDFFSNKIAYKSTKNKKGGRTGPPIHVRSALLYNQLIKKLNLQKKYPYIKSGEKIKFVYLKVPNPIKEDVIGFPQGYKLPEEFGLHSYIDWNLQYETSFIAPLKIILDTLEWNIENKIAVELF